MQAASDPSSVTDAGMSLVEIVVALAIVGVMTGVAVISMGASDRSAGPEIEARRLAARMDLAADLALIEGNQINLVWDENGYSFTQVEAAKARVSSFGERHELGSGLQLAGPSAIGSIPIQDNSGATVASFVVQGRDAGWKVDFDGLSAYANRIAPP